MQLEIHDKDRLTTFVHIFSIFQTTGLPHVRIRANKTTGIQVQSMDISKTHILDTRFEREFFHSFSCPIPIDVVVPSSTMSMIKKLLRDCHFLRIATTEDKITVNLLVLPSNVEDEETDVVISEDLSTNNSLNNSTSKKKSKKTPVASKPKKAKTRKNRRWKRHWRQV